ncbi:cysteine hydrolase [Candidatus Poribacteria bacterium]|nr:cysteine hydrolase [Candidatus Poribacteria bacterium]
MPGSAWIIIDVLVDFIDKRGTLYCGPTAEKIVPFIREKVEHARQAGDLVIYMTDNHKIDDKEFRMFPRHAVKGTPGAQIIPDLRPQRGDIVIPKPTLSCFYKTKLDEVLARHKVKHVNALGVCTSICVMDMVGELRNRGYAVRVYKKGVADFDQKYHRFALERMVKTYGAEVV